MTLQQLIEEKIKEFKERFVYSEPYEDNLAFVKSGVIKAIDEFLVSLAKEAYQAGREEAGVWRPLWDNPLNFEIKNDTKTN